MPQPLAHLVTERLRLRRVTEADVPAVVTISTDPGTNLYRPGGTPTQAESETIVRGFIRDWQRHGIGYWVVEYEGEVIGVAGVMPAVLRGRDCWNLYYRFSPAAWGKGLATEATRAAIAVAHEREPKRPVVARTRPDNAAAARLAERIGMLRWPELDGDGFIVFAV